MSVQPAHRTETHTHPHNTQSDPLREVQSLQSTTSITVLCHCRSQRAEAVILPQKRTRKLNDARWLVQGHPGCQRKVMTSAQLF